MDHTQKKKNPSKVGGQVVINDLSGRGGRREDRVAA